MQQQFSKWQEFGSYIYEVTTIMTTLLLKRNLQLAEELLEEYYAYKWKTKNKERSLSKSICFICIIYSVFFNTKRKHIKMLKAKIQIMNSLISGKMIIDIISEKKLGLEPFYN